MNDVPRLPTANITALSESSHRVREALAEFKADAASEGAMGALSWEQAFALASVGSIVREVPGSTYPTSKLVFDCAQRSSFAWYFEPVSIRRCLEALTRKELLVWCPDGLQAHLTPKAARMLLAAGRALQAR